MISFYLIFEHDIKHVNIDTHYLFYNEIEISKVDVCIERVKRFNSSFFFFLSLLFNKLGQFQMNTQKEYVILHQR